jgi:prolyl oligopeptidase PreP (S9A serine peptidase family)
MLEVNAERRIDWHTLYNHPWICLNMIKDEGENINAYKISKTQRSVSAPTIKHVIIPKPKPTTRIIHKPKEKQVSLLIPAEHEAETAAESKSPHEFIFPLSAVSLNIPTLTDDKIVDDTLDSISLDMEITDNIQVKHSAPININQQSIVIREDYVDEQYGECLDDISTGSTPNSNPTPNSVTDTLSKSLHTIRRFLSI